MPDVELFDKKFQHLTLSLTFLKKTHALELELDCLPLFALGNTISITYIFTVKLTELSIRRFGNQPISLFFSKSSENTLYPLVKT
mmetsp:Transcript_27328/g.62717  ORF Transcript_27328/g.62717 Transcript_27328/m.62717 type:complete len:85 (-) Transcript_27328:2824-3078(-)